jgi:hypothetical protein
MSNRIHVAKIVVSEANYSQSRFRRESIGEKRTRLWSSARAYPHCRVEMPPKTMPEKSTSNYLTMHNEAIARDHAARVIQEHFHSHHHANPESRVLYETSAVFRSPAHHPKPANVFNSRLFSPPPERPEWISGVTAKQTGFANTRGFAEQQRLLDPRSKLPLATDWHGRSLNDHVYTGPLHQGQTVFSYKPLPKGHMAAKLEKPAPAPPKQEPKGRVRRINDFFEAEVPLYH